MFFIKKPLIIIFLLLLTAATFAAIGNADAHSPPISVQTYPYLVITPNPVGVGQTAFMVMWLHGAPPTAAGIAGDRWRDFTLEITKPDGTIETRGPYISDPTGSTYDLFIPTQTGTYTVVFKYSGQVLSRNHPTSGLPGSDSVYIGDTFLPSSVTKTLIVQEGQISKVEDYPLPSKYWIRPIEGQNTGWANLVSNWLRGAQIGERANLFQKDGLGPNSPHIMWTMPIELGGVVGGSTAIPGIGFYSGGAYEGRFANAMVIAGRLYFQMPQNHAGGSRSSGAGYISLDLRTGEKFWLSETIGVPYTGVFSNLDRPTMKGQLFNYESMNQHGVVGGNIWQVAGTTWIAYDAFNGNWIYNLTKVPSGFEVYTDKGEILRYVLNYNTASNSGSLALWNNTQDNVGLALEIGTGSGAYQWRPMGKTVDMSKAYSWNVTVPNLSGSSAPAIVAIIPGDIILGSSSTFGRLMTPNPYTLWAISDKPQTRGQLLWIKNYPAPEGDKSRGFIYGNMIDAKNRIFIMNDLETMELIGYSLDSGEQVWGPVTGVENDFNYYGGGFGAGQLGYTAYGNVYIQGYGGELICYSGADGTVQWKYSRNSGLETPWGNYPIMIAAIADGKVYAFNNEHSPNYPLYKDYRLHCIDAYSGQELWTMMSWVGQIGGAGDSTSVLAEGFFAYYNYYDGQVYCVGKGPSMVTLSASPKVVPKGSSLIIEGTVTDICSGAKKIVDDGLFSIVPAVSDASMGRWMEYLYMQKPMPTDVTGVQVHLTATYPNGNTQDIGYVTTDVNGGFKKMWTPVDDGEYTISACFEGSNSYWSSSAVTYIGVGQAQSAITSSPSPAHQPDTGLPIESLLIGIAAVVIIVVLVVAAILMRKRK